VARPLKVDNTTPISLKEMTDVEMNYIANRILDAYHVSALGALTVNSNPGSYTSIGAFVDTSRPGSVGDHPASSTINSTTYTFRQNRQTGTEGHVGPMVFDTTLDGIQQAGSTELGNKINAITFGIMSASGLASYALQASAPSGGTWTTRATITDTAISGNATTKLWQKTADTTPSIVRPLLFNTGLDGIKEATDAEISLLVVQYHNWLMANNKGHYYASANAPGTGTWVQVGSVFTDSRQQRSNSNYTGAYSGTYTGNYTGSYAGTYILYYRGWVGGYFTGYYAGTYTGNYTGSYSGTYAGATIQASKENVSTIKLWLRTA
jgi:hypothetical protein|tara:strand:+ start:363 stop:1328 length:966 start_codon:yes stop_codon:yes gene_type:complete